MRDTVSRLQRRRLYGASLRLSRNFGLENWSWGNPWCGQALQSPNRAKPDRSYTLCAPHHLHRYGLFQDPPHSLFLASDDLLGHNTSTRFPTGQGHLSHTFLIFAIIAFLPREEEDVSIATGVLVSSRTALLLHRYPPPTRPHRLHTFTGTHRR